MNLYTVTVKKNSWNADTIEYNIVASSPMKAGELGLQYAKRSHGEPTVRDVRFDRAIHRVAK